MALVALINPATNTGVVVDLAQGASIIPPADAAGLGAPAANLQMARLGPVSNTVTVTAASITSTGGGVLSGTPNPGQTLTVTARTWSVAPTSIERRWVQRVAGQRLVIPGTTGLTYVIATARGAGEILVEERAFDAQGRYTDWFASNALTVTTPGEALAAPVLNASGVITSL